MAAETTADGKFSYDTVVNGMDLLDHAARMNNMLEAQNHWKNQYELRRPGRWGVEINVCRIGNCLPNLSAESTITSIAEDMHVGWSNCFKYWWENKPWISHPGLYLPPGKALSSNDKLKRSQTPFAQLSQDQQDLYFQMANYVMENCR